jgi:fluoride exporter
MDSPCFKGLVMQYLLVFLGCGLGGMSRYWISLRMIHELPIATLIVNVSGSFLIGLVAILLIQRHPNATTFWLPLLVAGFLGGYTTFSSFSLETLALFQAGKIAYALAYILASVVLCLLGVWLGAIIARSLG